VKKKTEREGQKRLNLFSSPGGSGYNTPNKYAKGNLNKKSLASLNYFHKKNPSK
jgi:hypothetical protein